MVSIATCMALYIALYIAFHAHLGSPHFAIRHQDSYGNYTTNDQTIATTKYLHDIGFDHLDSKLQPSQHMQFCQIGNHKYEF